jgi:hypothetical protein
MTRVSATPDVAIRGRRPEDLPRLVEILAAQQPASRYPFRWPLPFPVEEFVVRSHEEAGWVALVDGRLVGHVSVGRVEGHLAEAFVGATGRRGLPDGEADLLLMWLPERRVEACTGAGSPSS